MDRRTFMAAMPALGIAGFLGCRGKQTGEVVKDCKPDMVGSHAAGAEAYKPMIDEALTKLFSRQNVVMQAGANPQPGMKKMCFIGLENKSSEDLGDFKDQIIQTIDTKINQSGVFEQISMRYTQAAMQTLRIKPDDLFLPQNMRAFAATMEKQGSPFDYMLFATLTSGTTRNNDATQKDYMLTLELIDIATGKPDKETATIRKGYKKTHGLR